jgi:hypothetical protein
VSKESHRSYTDVAGRPHSENKERRLQKEASDRISLAEEYQRVLNTIRKVEGLERFLMPKPFSSLACASKGGPVILINVHESRCDALVICSPADDLIHVRPSSLSQDGVTAMHQQFLDVLKQAGVRERGTGDHADSDDLDRSVKRWSLVRARYSDVLSRLWEHVVDPILEAMEEKVSWLLYFSTISLIRIA